jgi:hypothetical protein
MEIVKLFMAYVNASLNSVFILTIFILILSIYQPNFTIFFFLVRVSGISTRKYGKNGAEGLIYQSHILRFQLPS